jgi:hypothetical protein
MSALHFTTTLAAGSLFVFASARVLDLLMTPAAEVPPGAGGAD